MSSFRRPSIGLSRCTRAAQTIAPLVVTSLAFMLSTAIAPAGEPDALAPERKAIAWLGIEVPRWTRENACLSCHNNGDAARALLTAQRAGLLADRAPLADTLRFLATPERWDANGPDGPFKDRKLARIQFAAALTEAARGGVIADLRRARPLGGTGGRVADCRRQLGDRRHRSGRLAGHVWPRAGDAALDANAGGGRFREIPRRDWQSPRLVRDDRIAKRRRRRRGALGAGAERTPRTCRPEAACAADHRCAANLPPVAGARSSIRPPRCSTRRWSYWR